MGLSVTLPPGSLLVSVVGSEVRPSTSVTLMLQWNLFNFCDAKPSEGLRLSWIIFVLQKLHVVTELSAGKHTLLLKEWNYIQVSVSHCPRLFHIFYNDVT